MPALTAILRECVEQPDDDAPRHILADWLEEHGDAERAEFVRGQLALARMDEDDPARRALASRLEKVRRRKAWVDSLPEQVSTVHLNRGLMDVQLSVEELAALQADAEGWDWVQSVYIIGALTPASITRLGAAPLAPRLVSLGLG